MDKKNNDNVLLTKGDLLKEEFNAKSIEEAKNITEFLLHFSRVLMLGVEANLISKEEFTGICNLITNAIQSSIIKSEENEFADTSIQIANYMYVITLYLLTKTNWDAWQELSQITSYEKAKNFIFNVKKWMEKQITKQLVLLDNIKEKVQKLKVNNVTNCYLVLRKLLHEFSFFDNTNSNFSLKYYHTSAFLPGTYIFLVNDFDFLSNFYYKICRIIHNFRLEVSIMLAVNAGGVINSKIQESSLHSLMDQQQLDNLDKKYKEMLEKLHDKYIEDLNICLDPTKKSSLDEVELERKYKGEKQALEEEWEEEVAKLESIQDKKNEVMFEILDKDYSLEDIIREYAIFSLAKKGKIIYPSDAEERAKMLISIKFNVAIEEFIQGVKLTDEQIKFLQKAML